MPAARGGPALRRRRLVGLLVLLAVLVVCCLASNLAARYANRLADVVGLAARVIPDPVAGTPLVVPIGAIRR